MTKFRSSHSPVPSALLLSVLTLTSFGCRSREALRPAPGPPAARTPAAKMTALDLTKVQPNEAGLVPILEYHNLTNSGKVGGYEYPAAEFRRDIAWLYAHDYRPISLADYAQGRIDCPAGTSPVILTFDDALLGQFSETADGEIDSDCAVGILDAFHTRHPDWPLRATFFVLTDEDPRMPPPFTVPHKPGEPGQEALASAKMQYLVKEGFEIGNHTLHHSPKMRRMMDAQAEAEFAGGVAGIHKYLPGYAVRTLALPYGIFPRDARTVIAGRSGGVSYHHLCAMDAGWRPAPSPLSKGFRPYRVPRIIPGDERTRPGGLNTIRYWLAAMEKNKALKFVSDGDPATYTVPAAGRGRLDAARLKAGHYFLRTYSGTQLLASR